MKPARADILAAAGHLGEMLQIRKSSRLFRLGSAEEVQGRLAFHNTGPGQVPGLIVMSVSDEVPGAPDLDPDHESIVVLINAGPEPVAFEAPGEGYALHPTLREGSDERVKESRVDGRTFRVPGRTAAVFVAS